MSLTLRVLTGSAEGKSHTLDGPGTMLVGRSSRSGLMLPSGAEGDLRVSHTHALVEFNPPECRVYDLNSRNGVRINGQRVKFGDLKHGDELTLGQTKIVVQFGRLENGATIDTPIKPEGTFDAPTVHPIAGGFPTSAPRERIISNTRRRCRACKQAMPIPGLKLCEACNTAAEKTPQVIPGYRLVKELGRGAMGVVFTAISESEDQRFAVKTFPLGDTVRPVQVTKFLREAEILSRLKHPYIVRYRGSGIGPGGAFLAMDYVHGLDLKQLLAKKGPFTVLNAVRAIRQALAGLSYAHERGYVHRDLKPSNLMLELKRGKQTVKITDFGLARAYHASQLSGLTLAGEVGGTPAYLPPEQIVNFREAAPAADQYSMASTLYTLLTGKYPYDFTGTVAGILAQILDEDPIPVMARRADLPTKLAAVLHKAMSRNPADRFASVAEFSSALEPFSGK